MNAKRAKTLSEVERTGRRRHGGRIPERAPWTVLPRRSGVCVVLCLAFFLARFGDTYAERPPKGEHATSISYQRPPVAHVYGANPGDALGSDLSNGIAFGDINGDGFDDMIVGAWLAGGRLRPEAGEVYVVYGRADLPGASVDMSASPGTHGETRILGGQANSFTGGAVACDDIDGDGFDDVVIGAMWGDGAAPKWAGEVFVVYGDPSLPGRVIELKAINGDAGGTHFLGATPGDLAGYALATGDVNGDGLGDIVIGAPGIDPAGGIETTVGGAYVVHGRTNLRGATVVLTTATAGVTLLLGESAGDQAGAAVGTGDANGDGFDDVLIGVPGEDPDGRLDAGSVYVFYGSANPPGAPLSLGAAFEDEGMTRVMGDDPGGKLGIALATGDVNRDGFDDLVVGAPRATFGASSNAGAVYVIPTRDGMAGETLDLSAAPGSYGEARIHGAEGAEAGMSVAACDSNGDGFDDVLVGSWRASAAPGVDSGTIHQISGDTLLAGALIDLGAPATTIAAIGLRSGDLLGCGAEGGADLNRDGLADFAASAPRGDNSSQGDEGYVVAGFGGGDALKTTVVERLKAGKTPARGMGGRLAPVSRAWLSFEQGDNGHGQASVTTVTLLRSTSESGVDGQTSVGVSGDVWQIATDRVGFTSAGLVLQYLESAVDPPGESELRLYQADSLEGPWNLVAEQTLDTRRNILRATAQSLSYFFIGRFPPEYSLTVNVIGNGSVAIDPRFDFYMEGTTVSLTATPEADHDFIGWAGDAPVGQETDNPLVLVMDASKTITASFELVMTLEAPGNVVATDHLPDKVAVSWAAVDGATHYQVHRSDTETSTKTALSDWRTPVAYDDATAKIGVTYFYWIKAAASETGALRSAFSAPDQGMRARSGVERDYKIVYKKCALEIVDGNIEVTGATPSATIKIAWLKKGQGAAQDTAGTKHLTTFGIPKFSVAGGLKNLSSEAPIWELTVDGFLKALRTKNSVVETIEANAIGSIKMLALANSTSSLDPEYAATNIFTTRSGFMKVSLTGVILESLATRQNLQYIKVASKAYRDKTSGEKRVSLSGVGRVTPALLADAASEVYVLATGSVNLVSAKGCSVLPDTLESHGGALTLSVQSKKLNKVNYDGFLGFAGVPWRMRVLAPSMRNIFGDAGVSGVFVAGFDAAGAPTYTGAIKSIGTKGTLEGEAHVSPTAKPIKFKPEQGGFTVHTTPAD